MCTDHVCLFMFMVKGTYSLTFNGIPAGISALTMLLVRRWNVLPMEVQFSLFAAPLRSLAFQLSLQHAMTAVYAFSSWQDRQSGRVERLTATLTPE